MDTPVDQAPWRESEFIPYQAVTRCPPGPVLVLAPHPDDEVFGCGGAILSHLAAGDPVKVIIATDSDFGSFVAGAEGIRVRRKEAEAAARVLGYGVPSFLGLPDRGLTYDETLIDRVRQAVEQSGAAMVYAPSWWEIHPDHCVLAMATVEAVKRCPQQVILAMYEVGVPLHPNLLLNITDLMARKLEAMACFQSQLRMQPYDSHLVALNHFRTFTLPAEVEAAEAFRLFTGADLRQDPLRAIRPGLYYAQSQIPNDIAAPLVSVLFLGGREDIADALDSVMLQTYAHIEIIVVPDWRMDVASLPQELKYWRSGRFPIRVLECHPHLSLAEKANLAMADARGDWLLLMGVGDRLKPNHVARLQNSLAKSTLARCGCAGVQLVQPNNGQPKESHEWQLGAAPRQLQSYASIPLSAVMFAQSLLTEGCRFDNQLGDRASAWDFWLQLSSHTPWVIEPEVTTRHFYRDDAPRENLDHLECQGITLDMAIPVIQKWLKQGGPSEELAFSIWHGMASLQRTLAANMRLEEQVELLIEDLKKITELANSRHEYSVILGVQLTEQNLIAKMLEEKCAELQDQISSMHKSTSWRLTRPLRRLGQLLHEFRIK